MQASKVMTKREISTHAPSIGESLELVPLLLVLGKLSAPRLVARTGWHFSPARNAVCERVHLGLLRKCFELRDDKPNTRLRVCSRVIRFEGASARAPTWLAAHIRSVFAASANCLVWRAGSERPRAP